MKTRSIARGIGSVIALASAIGAVGCSGEPLSPEEAAEIGVSEQALAAALPSSDLRTRGDGCRLFVAGAERVLFAGGISDLGLNTVEQEIYLASGNTFETLTGTTALPAAASDLVVINDPASPLDTCLVIGGQNGSGVAVSNSAYRLVVSKNAPPATTFNIAKTDLTSFTARSLHQVAKCGSNSVIAVGGQDNGTTLNSIQVLKSGANAWSAVTGGTLATDRKQFGLAVANDGTLRNFIVTGGSSSSAGELDSIEALKFDADCDVVTRTALASPMAIERDRSVVFESAYDAVTERSTFRVPGGFDGTNVLQTMDTLIVDWTGTPTFVSSTQSGNVLQGPTHSMKLVLKNNDAFILGGVDGSNNAVDFVSEFAFGGSAFVTQTDMEISSVSSPRVGHAAFYLPTADKIQVIGGNSGNTVLGTSIELTP